MFALQRIVCQVAGVASAQTELNVCLHLWSEKSYLKIIYTELAKSISITAKYISTVRDAFSTNPQIQAVLH